MQLLMALLCSALVQLTTGATVYRPADSLSQDIQDFRSRIGDGDFDEREAFFDIEVAINRLDDEEVKEVANEFRKDLTLSQHQLETDLFELELLLNAVDDSDMVRQEQLRQQREEQQACNVIDWRLGMNLNPADGHIMDFTTGWATGNLIGTKDTALQVDYLNNTVWNEPANYVAIVRHQQGVLDAVKVFKFINPGLSLKQRFDCTNAEVYRSIVTKGGPIQEAISPNATNLSDDPIFSVGGDLAFNWGYGLASSRTATSAAGTRIVMTEAHMSAETSRDYLTQGLGNNFRFNPSTGLEVSSGLYKHEIANLGDKHVLTGVGLQGTDYGTESSFRSGDVYGNYAIYVSQDATTFPEPGSHLNLDIKHCH